ncbi:DNA-processing protein DprA [Niabella ginsengisoli]|uniref:DNA-processing protein DprA n=1 Tax=Niabella ginsengisoli TaxID=522298 RepID=A0ABS9SNW0_9BACT|nr:DNA-processing protein DprA [Niabella ginsengisoli]MCH5600054.1 DNA-processing protein DprA [Niabella ginsengisoli]
MSTTLLYQIALTLIPGIGCVQARNLLEHMEPEEIFKAPKKLLEKIDGLGEVRIKKIRDFKDFTTAEKEIAFIEKYKISPLFINDSAYPQRLLNCYDAPIMLYYRGSAHLNQSKVIAIVGSRAHTEYGKSITENMISELAQEDILVVSGLAYGIDSVAHRACLKNNIQTVGVLAHGLDKIYPSHHTDMAKDMIKHGGLLTEFRNETIPDRHNFPSRNRIVAGMSDATIVVETDIKGGSMITAELANGYNKDVFAFPGKIMDKKSTGCNYLIKSNKALLLTDAQQLLEAMGWTDNKKAKRAATRELFLNFTADEKVIIDLLTENPTLSIDEINLRTSLSSSAIAASILSLEMKNVLQRLPGKLYQII